MRLAGERGATLALVLLNLWRWNGDVNALSNSQAFRLLPATSSAILQKLVLLSRTASLALGGLAFMQLSGIDAVRPLESGQGMALSLLAFFSLACELLVPVACGLQQLAVCAAILLASAAREASDTMGYNNCICNAYITLRPLQRCVQSPRNGEFMHQACSVWQYT